MPKAHYTDWHLTVGEAQRMIHDPEITHSGEKVFAAATLMEACEHHDSEVTFADMLRCLDYGGTIAEMGWRCLYVRTGRENMPIDRTVWETYLREHYPNDVV
jgi:hypothetical protein